MKTLLFVLTLTCSLNAHDSIKILKTKLGELKQLKKSHYFNHEDVNIVSDICSSIFNDNIYSEQNSYNVRKITNTYKDMSSGRVLGQDLIKNIIEYVYRVLNAMLDIELRYSPLVIDETIFDFEEDLEE